MAPFLKNILALIHCPLHSTTWSFGMLSQNPDTGSPKMPPRKDWFVGYLHSSGTGLLPPLSPLCSVFLEAGYGLPQWLLASLWGSYEWEHWSEVMDSLPWDNSRLDQRTAPDRGPSLLCQIYSNHFFLLYLQLLEEKDSWILLFSRSCTIPSDFLTFCPFFVNGKFITLSLKVPS